MSKKELIEKIKTIITEYGCFGVGEVEADCSPCVALQGNICFLAEAFNHNEVEIECYNAKFSSDSIDSYTETYENLEKSLLLEIYSLAKIWKKINKK
jgi:hypothetical protein